MAWQLLVVEGPDRGKKADIGPGPLLIGRDPSSSLALSDSAISRNHARVIINPDATMQIEDLNSSNGTYVNKVLITGAVQLRAEDEVLIGGNRLQLFWTDSPVIPQAQGLATESAYTAGEAASTDFSISQALAAPFSSQGMLKWLLGSILSVLPVLSFFAEGYRFRLFQHGISGKIAMPEWQDWGELFIKGLLFFIIRLLYLLLPAVFTFLFIFVIALDQYLVLALFIVLFSIAGFFLPMGLAHFASTGDFTSAFQFGSIIRSIRAVFSEYIVAIIIFAAIWGLVVMLSFIPVIGWLFSVLGVFYASIVSGLLYGILYRRSRLVMD